VNSALLPILLLGLLNPGISCTLNLIGLARISASVAALLWAAEPVMILGLAAVVLREPVTPRLLIVMLIGAIGVALVTKVGTGFGSSGNDVLGIFLLLSAVLCCAFYTVFSRKVSEATDPLVIVALQQTAGPGWAIALLFATTEYGAPNELVTMPFGLIAASALSGLLYYAAAYYSTSPHCVRFRQQSPGATST
jgi:drug/metabolite transporter (DMT)-like permease